MNMLFIAKINATSIRECQAKKGPAQYTSTHPNLETTLSAAIPEIDKDSTICCISIPKINVNQVGNN